MLHVGNVPPQIIRPACCQMTTMPKSAEDNRPVTKLPTCLAMKQLKLQRLGKFPRVLRLRAAPYRNGRGGGALNFHCTTFSTTYALWLPEGAVPVMVSV